MNATSKSERGPAQQSFVLFPLGRKRFAFPSGAVAELARPDRLHTFPHTTPLLAGVLVRRGRIVPVCDVAPVLVGPHAPARKFYLIANRRFAGAQEWTAIPVTGECELAAAELLPPTGRLPEYVVGLLSLGCPTLSAAKGGGDQAPAGDDAQASRTHELIEVVDLEKLIASHSSHVGAAEVQS